LILRSPGRGVRIEPEASESVVEKGLADRDLRPAATHPIIKGNDLLLHLGQLWVRSDLQSYLLVPVGVVIGTELAWLGAAGLDDPRGQEVLEALIGETEGPCVPAEPVESDRVWRNPAPARLRPGQRLILDLDGF